ncbi:small ribosomal subunit protein uS11m [Phlebotomus argentipes]|uniref:small ribosomal subunit protein uS11m n=1 Tax=Phlebotomus argentipes TaxID=94469 RepID=UPI00289358D2|nr:small ribosomal subunit protein uS11m [Phlebotomus argentipes]
MSLKCVFPQIINNFLRRTSHGASVCHYHTTNCVRKAEDRREMLASMPKKDEGTMGESVVDIDSMISKSSRNKMFPDADTANQLFNGVPFKELPICNIRVSKNNTIITMTDHKGAVKMIRSCGIEGFKNTRKGTNIAAQATAISISGKAQDFGIKTVRVFVQGLGPGRMSAIKGLQMGGMEIVSVTDGTKVSWCPPRPRKQRTL